MIDDPVRIWRQGRAYVQVSRVPLSNPFRSPTLFSWEVVGPGVYRSQADPDKRIRLMVDTLVENSFTSPGMQSTQVDVDNDLWNITALGCAWHGVSRDVMVGIEGMVCGFYMGLYTQALAIANEKRAERHLPPLPMPAPVPTPTPAPAPTEDVSSNLLGGFHAS